MARAEEAGEAYRAARHHADARPPHTDYIGSERRRQVGVPEDGGSAAVHAAVRTVHPRERALKGWHLQRHNDRHRRRAEHRERPLDLLVSLAEHEEHDATGGRTHAAAHRRVRHGHRAADWRRYGRGCAQPVCEEARMGRDNHPLPEPETLRRLARRHSQRRHALRPPRDATALPARHRPAGLVVRHRDCTQDGHTRRGDTRGERHRGLRLHTERQILAGHRARQALLGEQATERASAREGPGEDYLKIRGGDSRARPQAQGDSAPGEGAGAGTAEGEQPQHREHYPRDTRVSG